MPGTFITVGNARQPFPRLIDAAIAARNALPEPVVVQHGHTPCGASWARAAAFLAPDEFEHQVRVADVVVMHAGAGSILHAVQAGKLPIVMARLRRFGEMVDDHQLEFAAALAAQRRVLLIQGGRELKRAVPEALSRQATVAARPSQPPLVELVGEVLRRCARDARQ